MQKAGKIVPAADRVNFPGCRIEEGQVRGLNGIGEHELDQVGAGVLQLAAVEPLPPEGALTFDSPVLPWHKETVMGELGGLYKANRSTKTKKLKRNQVSGIYQ